MAHIHSVYDTDKHFTIDPDTRMLVNQTPNKAGIMQYDHNSERITFDLPAVIDGHKTIDCNRVEVHYLNIDAQTKAQNKGLYEVVDLQLSPEDENIAICSWLISRNATQLIGPLYFRVTFKCVSDPASDTADYVWSTAIYKGLSVSDGIYNSDYVVSEYVDILEQWRQELVRVSGAFTHSFDGETLTVTSSSGTSSAYLKGDPGEKGEKGDSGITMPIGGFFTLAVDQNGDLWIYSEEDATVQFEYDPETGDLYVVQEQEE